MPIPDYESIMLPLLKLAGDDSEHNIHDATEILASEFQLTQDERQKLLPSGRDLVFDNRVGWARTYLKKAVLLEDPRRAHFKITSRGKEVLKETPKQINDEYLKRFPEYLEFKQAKNKINGILVEEKEDKQTPEESLEFGYQNIKQGLIQELLAKVQNSSPKFFERLVVDLLVKMGYGGSLEDAGKVIGKSGDEGIDGIIKEDKLGLDTIYIQAKRWEGVVGRPEIMKFAGALQGKRAKKGVFITTSKFTSDAIAYVSNIDNKIVLIDGYELAELMLDYSIGVSEITNYSIKKIDSDYFLED